MNEYFASKYYRGYNCFVMSKKIFNEYNKVLFDILFEFDKQFDTTGYEGNKLRATGYMGEIVYGVGCGLLTVFIRYFGGYPEGVSYAILLMNACAWALDKALPPVRFGAVRGGKAG